MPSQDKEDKRAAALKRAGQLRQVLAGSPRGSAGDILAQGIDLATGFGKARKDPTFDDTTK